MFLKNLNKQSPNERGLNKQTLKNWLTSEWCIRAVILMGSLYYSFLYALRHFEITSDSEREYQVYLTFVQQGHWSPLVDTMLSSSLWTTYLPSIIQRVVNLHDPTIVYRVVLALLVSFVPLTIYLILRKHTTILISGLLTVVFYTTFYYQASTSYARGQVALIMAGILLVLVTSNKRRWWHYLLMFVVGSGLIAAHYTTAYIYTGMFIGAGGLLGVYWLVKRRQSGITSVLVLLLVGLTLLGMEWWWYNPTYPGANRNTISMLQTVGKDTANSVSGLPVEPIEVNTVDPATPSQLLGIWIAKGLMMLRLVGLGVVLRMLWKQRRVWSVEGVLLFGSLLATTIAVSIPKIDLWLSALRVGYTLLPIQLVSIAYWWGKNRDDRLLIPILALWSVIYH